MRHLFSLIYIIGVISTCYASNIKDSAVCSDSTIIIVDTVTTNKDTYIRLSEEDYQRVAEELGIEVATMKCVVEVEAGTSHNGFVALGKPIINFDISLFKKFLRKKGISYRKHLKKEAFKKPDISKYGSYGKAQWARLESARQIDSITANEATFWGMFQIGGFNWKRCGCKSLDEFIYKMCDSEAMQLELFAQFCKSSNLVKYLRKKEWSKFAYKYNGPSYKSRGYHKKLKTKYNKHKKS